MKSKECKKHNHKLTNFLKVFIYMLVMLAPFFAIGIKCWYVANNKNAMESYRGTYAFDSYQLAEMRSQYQLNTIYYQVDSANITMQSLVSSSVKYKSFSGLVGGIMIDSSSYTFDYLMFNTSTGGIDRYVNDQVDGIIGYYRWIDNAKNCKLEFYSLDNINSQPVNVLAYSTYVIDNTLSSVFYSAVDELDDASIFSWTTNTGVYTAINNMCINLGIVSPPLAVLLTYWSLITAIYIIIDIVIESFTFLTHWFTDKMV